MSYDFDDPRLTAFALGELDDADKQDIERLLADHPEAALQVEQIRMTAQWLSDQLHDEQARETAAIAASPAAPALTLVSESPQPAARLPWWRRPGSLGPLARIAAFLMIGTLFGALFLSSRPRDGRPTIETATQAERSPSDARWAHDFADKPVTPGEWVAVRDADSLHLMRGRVAVAPPIPESPLPAKPKAMALAESEAARSAVARSRRLHETPLSAAGTSVALAAKDRSIRGESEDFFGRDAAGTVPAAAAPATPASGPTTLAMNAPKPTPNPSYAFGGQAGGGDRNAVVRGLAAGSSVAEPAGSSFGLMKARGGEALGQNGLQVGQPGPQANQPQGRQPGSQANQRFGREDRPSPGLSLESASQTVALGDQVADGQVGQRLQQKLDAAKEFRDRLAGQGQNGQAAAADGSQAASAPAELYARANRVIEALEAKQQKLASASPEPKPQLDKAGKVDEAEGRFKKEEAAVTELQKGDVAAVADPEPAPPAQPAAAVEENPFVLVNQEPVSTFAIDVDTASYTIVRRTLMQQNQLPPPDAVRIEEMLNYFPYQDAPPAANSPDPFAIHVETARCPWNAGNRLARIGIAGKPIAREARKPSNLVFLVDVSGSMDQPNKLPLVQFGLRKLVEQLGENDRVAIAVYASATGLVLPPTSCLKKAEILARIEEMKAGGSTNGGAGIQLAYDQAAAAFIHGGVNRVILATDGDFNVGVTDQDELVRLVESRAKGEKPIFLTVLGFGMDNLKDSTLEKLADKGNGHYAYIDGPEEAYKVLVEELGATLEVIAKDVKIQVEFMPERVRAYRLIGYENRVMPNQDFADDRKDGGEIGAGHHVTALYEIVPAAAAAAPAEGAPSPDSFIVRLRCKKPGGTASALIERPVTDRGLDYSEASDDFKFASSVAGFGMLLRRSPSVGSLTYSGVLELASPTLAHDPSGYRKEFLGLVQKARDLTPQGDVAR